LAMILALALQSKFAAVCGFVGSVATTITSLILPLLFFYTLRKRSAKKCGGSVTTTLRSILNLCILFVALGSIVVGAGGSLCNIWEIRSGVCVYIVPH
jgi:amino acid permease